MRLATGLLTGLILVVLLSSPVSGQFFLCEKTGVNDEPIDPNNPQYDNVEYDIPFVKLARSTLRIILIGVFAMGVLGSVYATIRDSMYTAEGDQDRAKYVRMRTRLILFGVGVPVIITIGSFIVESLTYYETTCFVPSII
jgi:heme/copper-type cytochrome/quinol oxidase subunit 2